MKGIVYKDLCLFFKGIDKMILLVLGGLLVLFAVRGGAYVGLLFSFGLDMMVSLLHLTAFEKEEKTSWGNYQRALPVGVGKVVGGKYAAVLLTVPVGAAGAAASNLIAFAVYRTFLPETLALSVLLAVVIPLAWTAFSLPFYYWMGNHVAQYTSMPLAFLLFFALKNFEDGGWTVPDVAVVARNLNSFLSFLLIGALSLAGIFLASLSVSAAGYCRRR